MAKGKRVSRPFCVWLVALLVAFNLCSCIGATMVVPAHGSSKYGPQNTRGRVGIVKYLNQGAGFVINSRRNDAYEMMYDDCGGKYDIIGEGPKYEDYAYVTKIGDTWLAGAGTSEYWYIRYRCVD